MPFMMTMLFAALATGTQHPHLGAFIMIVMGAVTFLVGFKQYRAYRILVEVPRARVRSIPMGLVHLQGKATGDPLTSPLTGVRCFCFMVNIEERVKTRTKDGGTRWTWQTVAGDDDLKQFYLDDGTGRVLVNPLGAEQTDAYSQRTFYCEIGKDGHFQSVCPTPGIPAPTEQTVWAYINGSHTRKLLDRVFDLEGERGRMMKSVMETSVKVLNTVQQIESLGTAPEITLQGSPGSGLRGGPYRVSEECFLADSDCVVLGTCAENPNAQSDEDRNIIRKGQNEETFLISTKGDRKIGRNLLLQAFALVFVGAAMIMGGFALALHSAGML
jgi:hypothetical protein